MSGFQIHVTQAGLNALTNAQNNGTQAILITQIGVTQQGFEPIGATSVPGEMKRLSSIAGMAVAADTLHVTLRDESSDAYTLRGFGLYLQDGTLFAVYGQVGEIVQKSAQASLLLATDIRFTQINVTALTFGETSFANPPASQTVPGVVRFADSPLAAAGADNSRAMTSATTRHQIDSRLGDGAPSAFVKPLLGMATAAALRSAIGLGSSAVRDSGAGNGLDADLLDGQHGAWYRQWTNLQGVPSTFPPGGHGHAWADISAVPATALRWPSWGEVTGKPSTFSPSHHGHSWGDISGVPPTATRWPTWSEVTNKPNNYPPDPHIHSIADVSGLPAAIDSKASIGNVGNSDLTGVLISGFYRFDEPSSGSPGFSYGQVLVSGGGDTYSQIAIDYHSGRMAYRGGVKGTNANWRHPWDNQNFNPESKANLSGASFTGPIAAPTVQATSSDARLKDYIADLRGCLDTVRRLRPRQWLWKKDGSADFGFIAQEHRKVLPGAVHEDDDGMLYVRYGKAEALLAGAIAELDDRLLAIEQRLGVTAP